MDHDHYHPLNTMIIVIIVIMIQPVVNWSLDNALFTRSALPCRENCGAVTRGSEGGVRRVVRGGRWGRRGGVVVVVVCVVPTRAIVGEAGGVEGERGGGPVAVDWRLYFAPRFVITMAAIAQHTICTEHLHHSHPDNHCHCHHHDYHDLTYSELEEVVVGAGWSSPNTGLKGNMGTMETWKDVVDVDIVDVGIVDVCIIDVEVVDIVWGGT